MAEKPKKPRIYVLAGVNGAGKSSIGGAMLAQVGREFFNPDAAATKFLSQHPEATQAEASARAWQQGRLLLERSILAAYDFAFETTLGGNTIPKLLKQASQSGMDVRVWYVGLEGVETHIRRVHQRVAQGGHDIPEARIRERYDRSRTNLLDLLPELAELKVFDNTAEADPRAGRRPHPKLLMHWRRAKIVAIYPLPRMPEWARPIVLRAIQLTKK